MIELKDVNIENLIYEIRGKAVMLDSNFARLYNVLMEQKLNAY